MSHMHSQQKMMREKVFCGCVWVSAPSHYLNSKTRHVLTGRRSREKREKMRREGKRERKEKREKGKRKGSSNAKSPKTLREAQFFFSKWGGWVGARLYVKGWGGWVL